MDILFFLLLAHIAGDYALQTDSMAVNKRNSIKSLSLHVLIYIITIWIFLFFYSLLYQAGLFIENITLIFLLVLYAQHWLQDYLKSRYGNGLKQMYYLDQFIHLLMLYLYRIFIY